MDRLKAMVVSYDMLPKLKLLARQLVPPALTHREPHMYMYPLTHARHHVCHTCVPNLKLLLTNRRGANLRLLGLD